MNSSVKQAQKDGATVENISAGLSTSVVKNALYKVIRCARPETLGENIVVQGGTFLSDAVLRVFEQEIGREVIRPKYSAIMGAYGAALYSLKKYKKSKRETTLISLEELKNFEHSVKAITCQGCTNRCRLTINTFGKGDKYIAGNRCERPLQNAKGKKVYNLYEYKNKLLDEYRNLPFEEGRPTVGLPLGLNMYELLPFWAGFFSELGFNVRVSPVSNRQLYLKGQHTIPSDTVCYPAKLMHGHIEALVDEGVDAVFYPDMTYNTEEGLGDNHFNCPVVAYYPQVIKSNVKAIENTKFICDFIGIHDKKQFEIHIAPIMEKHFGGFSKKLIKKASDKAYENYHNFLRDVREKAEEYLEIAEKEDMPVVVLSGRPYHIDPEINHGIDTLICSEGAVVITEDSVSDRYKKFSVGVRNQWTYHARLYAAARFVAEHKRGHKVNLVQLVSFGCGVDAVTTDEARAIVEESSKIYTQLKIDEITNTGAVRIRIRSLLSAAADRNN